MTGGICQPTHNNYQRIYIIISSITAAKYWTTCIWKENVFFFTVSSMRRCCSSYAWTYGVQNQEKWIVCTLMDLECRELFWAGLTSGSKGVEGVRGASSLTLLPLHELWICNGIEITFGRRLCWDRIERSAGKLPGTCYNYNWETETDVFLWFRKRSSIDLHKSTSIYFYMSLWLQYT